MAIVKRRLVYNNPEQGPQTMHFETSSDMVLRTNGTNIEASMVSAEQALQTKAAQSDLDTLSTTVASKASQADLTSLESTINTTVTTELAKKANDSEVTSRLEALESKITSLIATEIVKIVADAPEDFDTLKELHDWIVSHQDSASAMNSKILANETAISGILTRVAALENNPYKLEAVT